MKDSEVPFASSLLNYLNDWNMFYYFDNDPKVANYISVHAYLFITYFRG